MNKQPKFGRLLMVARIARGLSRREVGDRVGMDRRALGRIERGERLPSVLAFARLHKVLGFTASAAFDALVVPVKAIEDEPRKVSARRLDGSGSRVEFGRALGLARVDAGLAQVQVAGAVGCARRHVARMEAGRVLPSLLRMAQLWWVLGLDVDRLLALLREELVPPEPFAGFGQAVAHR